MKSLFLQDNGGNIMPVYSISAGLDYPGIGPEHAYMAKTGRAEYYPITDKEAVDSFFVYLSRMEGIIPCNRIITRNRSCKKNCTYNEKR